MRSIPVLLTMLLFPGAVSAQDGAPPPEDSSQFPAEPPSESEPNAASEPEGLPAPDLSSFRTEFTALMDELVQARSRIASLGRQLFQTRVVVRLRNRVGNDFRMERVALRLDGAPIFRGEPAEESSDEAGQIFDGFAAPGPHLLVVEVEQRSTEAALYRYSIRDTFRFEVIRGKLTEITIVLSGDSDIAEDFPDDEEGEYDIRTRVRVATRELNPG